MLEPDFWKGKRVLVTGHTGFKGAWLCLWLNHLGARVTGYALPPPSDPSLFEMGGVAELIEHRLGDVRDLPALEAAITAAKPEIVIHMAAQSLVRRSYRRPVDTVATNVIGRRLMRFIKIESDLASADLAKERRPYPAWARRRHPTRGTPEAGPPGTPTAACRTPG